MKTLRGDFFELVRPLEGIFYTVFLILRNSILFLHELYYSGIK